jgi:DNA-binding NtrC family response regulator
VLLVEDEELVRNMVKSVLEGHGYSVITASQADEACKMCSDTDVPIQLMITDVVMPGNMNSHDLAKHVSDQHPHIRILYMSGYTENTIVHHGILDSNVHFIQKPFTPAMLLTKVRDVLDIEN